MRSTKIDETELNNNSNTLCYSAVFLKRAVSISCQMVIAFLELVDGVAKRGPRAQAEPAQTNDDKDDIGRRHSSRDASYIMRKGWWMGEDGRGGWPPVVYASV